MSQSLAPPATTPSTKPRAWVTSLARDAFLPAVLVLWQSLCDVQTRFELCVIVTPDVSPATRDELTRRHIRVREFPVLEYLPGTDKRGEWWEHWKHSANKLNIFGMTEYEKLIMLDADLIVLRNIDELMDRPHMSAVADSPCILGPDHNYINAALVVIEPSPELLAQIMAVASRTVGQDQDILQAFFPDWGAREDLHLPQEYNVFARFLPEYVKRGVVRISNIRVLHYVGVEKPFEMKNMGNIHLATTLLNMMYMEYLHRATGLSYTYGIIT